MRKIGVWVLLFVLAMSFVLAANDTTGPSVPGGIGGEDVEDIQGAINNYTPLDEDGEVNFSKYKPFKTKAEERIDAINEWLDDNVSWMKYIFWMKPQISWLFVFNVYFILLFFLIFVLNADGIWFFIEKKSSARLFGLGIFVIFSVARLYLGLAKVLNIWITYIIDVLIPVGFWTGVILIGLTIVGLILCWAWIIPILKFIWNYFAKRRKYVKETNLKTDVDSIKKFTEKIIGAK